MRTLPPVFPFRSTRSTWVSRLSRNLSGGRLEQDGKWHCEYDEDGNLTERYIGTGRWLDGKKEHWKYRWNADGSLAKVVRPDGEEVTFEYDALGRRLSKSFGTTVTRWMWNGNVPLHQWKQRRSYSREQNAWLIEEERKERTLWLFEEESFVPAAMIKEGKAYSILTDHLGTPTEAYDTEGNEVWSRTLNMNGEVIEETGNVGMIPFLFQGQYYDRETGLAYNRFRYYSPQMGMYISQDPIGLAGGIFNLYGYVNDTNAWSDILGLHKNSNDTVGDWVLYLVYDERTKEYAKVGIGKAEDVMPTKGNANRRAETSARKVKEDKRFKNAEAKILSRYNNITKGEMKEIEAAKVRELREQGHKLPYNKEKDKRYQLGCKNKKN